MWKLLALCLLYVLSAAQTSEPLHCYGYGQVLAHTSVNDTMHDDMIRVKKYKVGQIFKDDSNHEHRSFLHSLNF